MKIFDRLELFILKRIPNTSKTLVLYEDMKFFIQFLIFIVLLFLAFSGIYKYFNDKENAKIHEIIKNCEIVKVNISERKTHYQCSKIEYIVDEMPSNLK